MKCILLCAGYATRLFPLTENFPKALLEIGGRPLLDYTLDEVNSIDKIDEIYLVTNKKYAPHFKAWADSKNNSKKITIFDDGTTTNENRLGAIGDIKFVIDQAKLDDDMLVIAGDNLFTFKLNDFVKFQEERGGSAVCVKEETYEKLKGLGVVQVNDEMTIIGFEEKPAEPKSTLAAYAEYIYPRETLPTFDRYIAEGNNIDAPGRFVSYLYDKEQVSAFKFEGECYDVGTHAALAEVNEIYSKKNK